MMDSFAKMQTLTKSPLEFVSHFKDSNSFYVHNRKFIQYKIVSSEFEVHLIC